MEQSYENWAGMPLETLVSTPEGQSVIASLIAAEGLSTEVNHHLDLLDIPETLRNAINLAAEAKLKEMTEKDKDASLLFSDTEPQLARTVTGFTVASTSKPSEIMVNLGGENNHYIS